MENDPKLKTSVAVIGAGHAGIEAALASARMGVDTVLFTLSLDGIANMPCNPSIGGTAKGHLVYEIDALGGEMGYAADQVTLQSRTLNLGKGAAVRSKRVQADRQKYHRLMKQTLENTPHLRVVQAEIVSIGATVEPPSAVFAQDGDSAAHANATPLRNGEPNGAPASSILSKEKTASAPTEAQDPFRPQKTDGPQEPPISLPLCGANVSAATQGSATDTNPTDATNRNGQPKPIFACSADAVTIHSETSVPARSAGSAGAYPEAIPLRQADSAAKQPENARSKRLADSAPIYSNGSGQLEQVFACSADAMAIHSEASEPARSADSADVYPEAIPLRQADSAGKQPENAQFTRSANPAPIYFNGNGQLEQVFACSADAMAIHSEASEPARSAGSAGANSVATPPRQADSAGKQPENARSKHLADSAHIYSNGNALACPAGSAAADSEKIAPPSNAESARFEGETAEATQAEPRFSERSGRLKDCEIFNNTGNSANIAEQNGQTTPQEAENPVQSDPSKAAFPQNPSYQASSGFSLNHSALGETTQAASPNPVEAPSLPPRGNTDQADSPQGSPLEHTAASEAESAYFSIDFPFVPLESKQTTENFQSGADNATKLPDQRMFHVKHSDIGSEKATSGIPALPSDSKTDGSATEQEMFHVKHASGNDLPDSGRAADGQPAPKPRVCSVTTRLGEVWACDAVIVATGTYLEGTVFVGDVSYEAGPDGSLPSKGLSASLRALGVRLVRFKTGTPARVQRRSIDFSVLEEQQGEDEIIPYSARTPETALDGIRQIPCHIVYTNQETHRVIRENITRSAMYSGKIHGTGPRYCPSIEDKLVRFADKDRHQLFVEPLGEDTSEMYLQGFSTSLPTDVQHRMLRTLRGFENAEIMRYAYAIEYDCADPTQMDASLAFKSVRGLYGAGQFNGTSGYEEAAAQGLVAGINAARAVKGLEPMILSRSESYIGTLIDDLVTKGTNEPYRMMTSRSEYRLLLRQDNADARLTSIGYRAGSVSEAQYRAFSEKQAHISAEKERLEQTFVSPERANPFLTSIGESELKSGASLAELLRRPAVSYESLAQIDPERPDLTRAERITVENDVKYAGYVARQTAEIARHRHLEEKKLPENIRYAEIKGLRIEAAQKLEKIRPITIGQASRISGVNPADISVLLIYLGLH